MDVKLLAKNVDKHWLYCMLYKK